MTSASRAKASYGILAESRLRHIPTGYMAAENADIEPGDTVAVWDCGPVGQFSIRSAWMRSAGRAIAIDRVPERLRMAVEYGKA